MRNYKKDRVSDAQDINIPLTLVNLALNTISRRLSYGEVTFLKKTYLRIH